MAAEIDGETGCTLQWRIENVSHCWWCMKREPIRSPSFIVEGFGGTKWSLELFSLGCTDEENMGFYLQRNEDCSGPEIVEVNSQLAFLGEDGSILIEKPLLRQWDKNDHEGFRDFVERRKVFLTDRGRFLPEDTLTVQCTVWMVNDIPVKSNYLFATTIFKTKRRSFEWRIEKISTLKSDLKRKFVDYFFGFDIVLKFGCDKLDINMIPFEESVKYISCNSSIIDSEGKRASCGIVKYFDLDFKKEGLSHMLVLPKLLLENRSRYLPNDVLSLDFEFVFSTVEHFNYRKSSSNVIAVREKPDCAAILIDEFKGMYNDHLFSDIVIRTPTKTFPAHKNILSARSAVFNRMFSHDMMEANSGNIDITDFEDDTVHRMLLYLYTASLDDLQLESAFKLYKIADKYQILPLKSKCSSFLIENLCPTNACDSLVLADLHHDDDLKNAVQDYMLGLSKQFFCSQEWKDFMNNHNKLAGDVMHRKITRSRIVPGDA